MKTIYFSLFFLLNSLYGVIIETHSFKEILNYVDQDTLVILDIDDTLLLPAQTLGNDVWFVYHHNKLKSSGLNEKSALMRAILDWEAIRKVTEMHLVEEGTDLIIQKMQEQEIKMMGLTTQALTMSGCTVSQLNKAGIDLAKTAPHEDNFYFKNPRGCLYKDGVLFTCATNKGHALLSFLSHIDVHPKKYVFINDKESHLREIEKELEPLGHLFIGLRYNIGDERVANFNPALAEYQWQHSTFHHLISDEEASRHLGIN